MLTSSVWAYAHQHRFPDLNHAYHYLGIDMKLEKVDHYHVNFLKGWFLPHEGSWYWVPALARFLKFGKCLKDPRMFTHKKDLLDAVLWFAHCIATQYYAYKEQPIFSAFVNKYYRPNTTPPHDVQKYVQKQYFSHHLDTTPIPKINIEDWANVYHIDSEIITALNTQVELSTPFTFLEHPGWVTLCNRDYGN